MNCCAAHRAIKTTAKGLLFSPVKHMCGAFGRAPGSVWHPTHPPRKYTLRAAIWQLFSVFYMLSA